MKPCTPTTKDISSLLDRGKKGILLTLDLAKAFDSIDRKLLIKSLPANGIKDNELKWVVSYFANRKQVVFFDGVNSQEMPINFWCNSSGNFGINILSPIH